VGGPAVVIYVVIDAGTWSFALQMVPIGLFFFYCFLLRLTVPTWDQVERSDTMPDFEI
jgi:hypothetical protein